MPKSDLVGKSIKTTSEVESESILTNIFSLAPEAEKVYADIEAFMAGQGPQDIADAKALFTSAMAILGPIFHIS